MKISELYSKSHDVNSLYLPLNHIREVHPEEKVIVVVLNRHWITKLLSGELGLETQSSSKPEKQEGKKCN